MNHFNKLKGILIGASLATGIVFAPAVLAGKNHNNQNNSCTQYRLSAYGGDAGFRLMSNTKNFRKTSNGSIVGQICNSGRVKVELSKRHPNTHVSLEVNGYEYVFGQGDRGDRHANNWFRRYVQVDLPRNSGYGGKHNSDSRGYANNYDPYKNNRGGHNDGYGNNDNSEYGYNPSNGQGYGQNNNHGYNNDHKPKHYNSRGYNSPEYFRAHSKRHKKAHRREVPHSHQGQYFAYQ